MIRQKTRIDQVLFKGSIEEFEATARDCAVKIHDKLLESDIFAIPPVGYEEPPYRGVAKVSLENPDGPEDIVGIVIASPEPGKIARFDVYRYEGTTGCEKAWGLLKAELVQRGWIDVQPTPAESTPTRKEVLARLRQQIEDSFNDEELRTLCFDMGVDYESLPAQGKAGKARELVACLDRRGRIPDLVAKCSELRPNVSWKDASEASGSPIECLEKIAWPSLRTVAWINGRLICAS